MLYRSIDDMSWFETADVDTPDMTEEEANLARDARRLRALDRLIDLGMELAEAAAQKARTQLAASGAADEDKAAPPPADPTAPFCRIAQAVRRTIWLEGRIAEGVKTRRAALAKQRYDQSENLRRCRRELVDDAIEEALMEAFVQHKPELDVDSTARQVLGVEAFLSEVDEFAGYARRPPGETIARLCKVLGFDEDFCMNDGEGWMIRRRPYSFETTADQNLPPSCDEGQTARPAESGAVQAAAGSG